MKNFKLIMLFCIGALFIASKSFGQANPFINVLPANSGIVSVGATIDIVVTIGNTGPISSVPQAKLRPIIQVPPSVVFLPTAQQVGLPTGWTILSNSGSQLRVCNSTDPIAVSTSRTIILKVQGVTVTGPQTFSGNINFGNGINCAAGTSVSGDLTTDNSATSTIEVVAPTATISTTSIPNACNGQQSGQINATQTGLTGTLTWSLNPTVGVNNNDGTFEDLAGGTYTVSVSNGSASTSAVVTLTDPPVFSNTKSFVSPCGNGTNGSITITSTGGTPYSGAPGPYMLELWQGTANSGTQINAAASAGVSSFSNLGAGQYFVRCEDFNACIDTINITLATATSISFTATATQINCAGGTGSAALVATGGTGAYTYLQGTTSVTNQVTGLAAGNYTFTATDANNGCIATATATIAPAPSAVLASAAITTPVACNGGSAVVTVSATSGVAPFTGTGTFTVSAGAYSYTVTDANGCTTAVSGTISQPTQLVASATAGTIACNGGTTTVTVSANGGTAPYTGTGTFTVSAGAYSYTVTDANGCTTAVSGTISQPTQLVASSIGGSVNCNTTSTTVNVTANGGTAPFTGTGTFTVSAGAYSYTVTDANGCTATTSGVVNSIADNTPPTIYFQTSSLLPGVTGPSSTQTSYLVPVKPGVKFTSLLSVNDSVGGYRMAGIPDGLGAFDNNDGTFTLLMSHELGNTLGKVRAHGAKGAFVSKWIINKNTLQVQSGSDLMTTVYGWNSTLQATGSPITNAFNRFCSADLPPVSAFYNAATGLGTQARIYMHGEEGGSTGYQLGTVASGPDAGKAYILGKFNLTTNGSGLTGLGGWENALANPFPQNKTVVIGNNDGGTGIMANSVAVYVGTKTNTGSEVDKAGLNNGTLSFVNVTGNPAEIVNTTTRATNITSGTAFTLSGTASTTFSRPEDGVWNPANPSQFFFVTTDQYNAVADGISAQIGRSRLWRLNFTDITNPQLGGTIDLLLNGTEGHTMFDNLEADKTGHLILLEDVGNQQHNGKMWQYTLSNGNFIQLAKHDSTRFGDVGIPATAPYSQDEEMSGVIDMSDILGPGMFLVDDQAHYSTGLANLTEVVEGGQLLAFFNPASMQASPLTAAADTIKACSGTGVNLGTPATADNCSVASVTNNAPTTFPVGTTTVTWTVTDASGNTATAAQTVKVSAPIPTTTLNITQFFSYVIPGTTTTITTSGTTNQVYAAANTCDSTVIYNVTIKGLALCAKAFLSGPYNATTGLMTDSLRQKGLLPLSTPYGSGTYTLGYTSVNNISTETTTPAVLAVTGNNAIVDWVFVQIRSKADSSIVLGTRSALIQRDGDIVDMDGTSSLKFADFLPDNFFVSVKHRNHIGIMTANKYALSLTPNCIDFTTASTPLFTFAGKKGNPAPLTGPTRIQNGVRTLYAGNCNILTALTSRFITYNVLTTSDRNELYVVTGGTNTLNGYTVYDVDMNGFARFNGLDPDRNVILSNCAGNNNIVTNEQTPN